MIILLLIILGMFTLGLIFAPAFIVSVMQLTILAVVCYILVTLFMKHREISYLIIVLYVFAVITMGAEAIGGKIKDINNKLSTLEKAVDKVDRYVQ